ncbi:MAG: hypothetical protein V1822_01955 [Candidatus Micrarchaeota archaeon]
MKLKIENEDKNSMQFVLSKSTPAFANMVRRYSMSWVPVFAVDKVTFYENSSTLFDEYIAHRIGLLPLKLGAGVRDDEEVLFSLDAQGPATVYSSALTSTVDKVKVATDKVPLLRLLEHQNLRLEAKAISGIGRKHAKWQAGMSGYEILDNGDFKFEFESFLQMSARDVITKAADTISRKCSDLEKDLKELKKEAKN